MATRSLLVTNFQERTKKKEKLHQKQADLLWVSLFENPALWPGELYELDIICNVSYLLQDSLERCEVNKGYKEALNTKYFKIHLYWNIFIYLKCIHVLPAVTDNKYHEVCLVTVLWYYGNYSKNLHFSN